MTNQAKTVSPLREEIQVPDHLVNVFRNEELAGLKLATQARLVAVAVIAVWAFFQLGFPAVFYFEIILSLFAVNGITIYGLSCSRFGRPWLNYLLLALDISLLTVALVVPNPMTEDLYPSQLRLRFGTFVYYFVFVALMALSYSPKLVLWTGFASALAWGAAVVWVISKPGTLTWFAHLQMERRLSAGEALTVFLDPHFVDIDARIAEVIVVMLVSGMLAVVVWRSRRLVIRQASAARERANLSRYFPPNIVDQLAQTDQPLGAVRSQRVAVMFADIVGFTRFSEREQPAHIVETLREFHARVEREVFDHNGTLDKFLGDGVMATFGTPDTGPRDAVNALRCARAILAAIGTWNLERARLGQAAIELSIGIHYGDVVLGDIGSERRLEFAVLGDVVNVASRLEELTRDLAARAIVSDALVRTVRSQAQREAETLLSGFYEAGPRALRGRLQRVAVWVLPTGKDVADGTRNSTFQLS